MSITSIIGTISDGVKVITSFERLSDDVQDLFGGVNGDSTYTANLEDTKRQVRDN